MTIQTIVLAAGGLALLVVLIKISLSLDEIASSLRKLARKRTEPRKAPAEALPHIEEDRRQAESAAENETVAAIAAARLALYGPADSEEKR